MKKANIIIFSLLTIILLNITLNVSAKEIAYESSFNTLNVKLLSDGNTDTVAGICAQPYYRKPMKFIGTLVNFVKIIVPIVIIGFGIIDLYKALTSPKEDGALAKAIRMIAIRVLAGVFIFFLPGIVQFVLNMVNEWSDYKNDWCCCTECILNSDCDVNSCSSNKCKIEGVE